MTKLENLHGVIPPLASPLTDEGKLDEPGLRKLVGHVLDGGVHALFVMGSTGEFFAFTHEQRRRAIEITVEETAGRVPVLAGVSDAGTELAARNAKEAEAAGADGVVSTMPYYFPVSTEEDVLEHFRHVAAATSLPLIMYNIPRIVKCSIGVETIARLAEDDTIVAVKDSSNDFNHFQGLILRLRGLPHFRIFQGSEFQFAASMFMGAHGGVLGISNLVPRLCVELYETAKRGEVEKAREMQSKLTAICQVFWAGESTLGGLKYAMSLLGLCRPTMTMPIRTPSQESRERIREILVGGGLLDS